MRILLQILLCLAAISMSACGRKESSFGGGKKRPPVVTERPKLGEGGEGGEGDLPAEEGPQGQGTKTPGGITEGPERIGPRTGTRAESAPERKEAKPAGKGNLPVADEETDESEDVESPREEAPRKLSPRRGDLPQAELGERPVFDGEGEVRSEPAAKPGLPWYPPNLDGTPAESWLFHNVEPALQLMETNGPATKFHGRPFMITFALGYFDGYQTAPLNYDSVNYGKHAPVDPFLRSVLHEALQRPCQGRLEVCGFELVRADEVQALFRREGPGGMLQQVRVLSGAETTHHRLNVGGMAAQQNHRSQKAERLFFDSFQNSDLVIYVGHSRDGGGPDFHPPRLKGDKVDYPFYRSQRPGLKKLTAALKTKGRKAQSVAILSCDSMEFFQGPLRQAAPGISTLTVSGQIYSEDLLAEGVVALDYFLREGTLQGLRPH